MTWPAALPGAVVRILRTAAGRRALHVVLLVGGLFALGFLSGEQAHAAEGVRPASSEVGPTGAEPVDGVRSLVSGAIGTAGRLTHLVTAPAATAPAKTAPEVHPGASAAEVHHLPDASGSHHRNTAPRSGTSADPGPSASAPTPTTTRTTAPAWTPAASQARTDADARPAAGLPARPNPVTTPSSHPLTDSLMGLGAGDQILGPPVARLVQSGPPVARLVQSVDVRVVQPVGGLVETVTAGLDRMTAQIPPLSSLPSLPVLPGSPGVPVLPGLTPLPGRTLPAPVAQAPQPAPAGHAAEAAVDDRRSGGAAGETTYGPRSGSQITGSHVAGFTDTRADATPAQRAGQRAAGAGYAPAQQAPDSDPTGELVDHAAVDNGTSRHSDAHAVTLNHRAPARLVPGTSPGAATADTQDRYRDIPLFPA